MEYNAIKLIIQSRVLKYNDYLMMTKSRNEQSPAYCIQSLAYSLQSPAYSRQVPVYSHQHTAHNPRSPPHYLQFPPPSAVHQTIWKPGTPKYL